MGLDPRNLEWLGHNSQRAYPLTIDTTKIDTSGKFTIPNDFVVSLYLAVHAAHNIDPASFHIKTIGAYTSGYSVTVGYNGTAVATALVSRAAHTKYTTYTLGGLGNFIDATGHLVIGSLDNTDLQPSGQFEFTPAAGRLEVDAIRPNLRNVTSLQVQQGTNLSARIYGDVVLRAGNNVRITQESEVDLTTLQFDAIEGEGLSEECVCGGAAEQTPIYTINGIPATEGGDFSILGSTCLAVAGIEHGIQLEDRCAAPCCGCEELKVITDALEIFGRQLDTLDIFVNNLEARTTEAAQIMLASKFGDKGCYECSENP